MSAAGVRQRGGCQEPRERVSPPFADTKKPTMAFETRSAVEIDERSDQAHALGAAPAFRLTRSRIEPALTSGGPSKYQSRDRRNDIWSDRDAQDCVRRIRTCR